MDTGVLIERAQLLLEQGRIPEAEKNIREALQQEPENDFALALLARCYFNRKEFAKGIELIEKAISIFPQEPFYYYLLGFAYYQQDNYTQARYNLDKVITLNPFYAEAFGLYSYILLEEKQFENALQKANEGLAIDAENITCLNARSTALNKLKRTDDAFATMQDALSQDPENEFTHTTIGWNLLERGQHNEAAGHFREALRLNPTMANAQAGLKEALKSKILPYKLLLQYSFWLNNKGRSMQVAVPLVLYFGFRSLSSLFKANNHATAAYVVGGIYLLFVVGTWTLNSVANFFLLFHKDGKYALTNTEKWSSVTVVSSLIIGISLLAIATTTQWTAGTAYHESLLMAAMVCISLALPLGEIQYPLSFTNKTKGNRISLALAGTGLLSLLVYLIAPGWSFFVMVIYLVGFMIYNWSGLFRK
jgi:tetratricopeptide (TPR) repeat protein